MAFFDERSNCFGTPSVISSVKRLAEDVLLARVIDLLFER